MTEEEFTSLIEKYITDDKMVNYSDFVDSIDQAFTIKGIDKKPSVKVTSANNSTVEYARKKYLEFEDGDEDQMTGILEQYRRIIFSKRLNIKPMFQDFDITKSGHISKT